MRAYLGSADLPWEHKSIQRIPDLDIPDVSEGGSFLAYYKLIIPSKNFGKTPAKNVRVGQSDAFYRPGTPYPPRFTPPILVPITDIPPSADSYLAADLFIAPKHLDQVMAGTLDLCRLVRYEYEDIFGNAQVLQFVAILHGTEFQAGRIQGASWYYIST